MAGFRCPAVRSSYSLAVLEGAREGERERGGGAWGVHPTLTANVPNGFQGEINDFFTRSPLKTEENNTAAGT